MNRAVVSAVKEARTVLLEIPPAAEGIDKSVNLICSRLNLNNPPAAAGGIHKS